MLLGVTGSLPCCLTGPGDFFVNYLKPFGGIFVNPLKFIVVPVVLFSMIGGFLSIGDIVYTVRLCFLFLFYL